MELPPGAVATLKAPAGSGFSTPSAACINSPNTLGFYEYWRDDQSVQSVISWIADHPPAGGTVVGGGYAAPGGVIQSESVTYAFLGIPGVTQSDQLSVAAVRLPDGNAALLVDSQVVWLVQRPASEKVPPGVSTVNLVFQQQQYDQSTGQPETSEQTVEVTDPSQVAQIIALTNSLPVMQPGSGIYSCPAFLNSVDVTFDAANGDSLAEAFDSQCGPVGFSIGGRSQYGLADNGYEHELQTTYDDQQT